MYILCKLLYITVFALLSAAPPYLPLYYHDVLRFSSDQIGFTIAIAPFIQSIACPLWTYLVDKRPRLHGPVMAITSFLGGLAVMGIMLVGRWVAEEQEDTRSKTSTLLSSFSNDNRSNTRVVVITCAFALAFAFFTLPNTSLVDSAVVKMLGPNKILYGEQRLWGSVSTGLTILLVGVFISAYSIEALFYVFAGSTVCFIVCAACTHIEKYQSVNEEEARLLPPPAGPTSNVIRYVEAGQVIKSEELLQEDNDYLTAHENPLLKVTSSGSIVSMARTIREEAEDALANGEVNLALAMSRVASVEHSLTGLLVDSDSVELPSSHTLTSPRVLSFLLTTLLFGMALSMIINFLFLFFKQELHMGPSLMGWTGVLGGATELLCFCFAKQMTERWGVTRLIVGAHLVTILRCLAYTLLKADSLPSTLIALALQTTHGIGFAVFWGTAVSEMDSFFPPEQRAVAQGVLGALHAGLGTGLGALLGGYIDQYLDMLWVFRGSAMLCAASITVFCLGRLSSR
ncbi:hypothetical protein VTP01DRAFT_6959 [Rhizomucor pusillus]|uniref:uncharacterized protein n=1 Tax=Rhizomucor pusillus TaxID=4840 RepID=UPI0037445CDE